MEARSSPLCLLTGGDEPIERRWIVPNLIGAGEVTLLAGKPTAGKSTLATYLACQVSEGGKFLGLPCDRTGVLYVAPERFAVTRRRARAMRAADALEIVGWRRRLDFSQASSASELIASLPAASELAGHPIGVVVIDTVAACSVGMNENDPRDSGLIAAALQEIADAGPAVIAVHHMTKDGRQVRGSSVLLAAADRVLEVQRRAKAHKLIVDEVNDGPAGARYTFAIVGVQIGSDPTTGEPIETGIISDERAEEETAEEEARDATPSGARRLTPIQQRALELLLSFQQPEVPVDAWRRAFHAAFPDAKVDTRKKNFKNALEAFSRAGFLSDHNHTIIIDGGKLSKTFPDLPFIPVFPASAGGNGAGA